MATDLRRVPEGGARTTRVGEEFPLEPARRRVRLPEVALGVVVVLAFALGAVLWQLNATQKEPVLAAAHDIARGDVLDATDVTVVYVSADDPIAHIRRDQSGRVLGRVALAELEAGALLTPRSFSEGPVLQPGEGVVGLALEPGQVPSSRLRAGDLVNVVTGEPRASPTSDDVSGRSTALLAERAEVFAVEELRSTGRTFVSLKMPQAAANGVASAAERGAVRLVMVGP